MFVRGSFGLLILFSLVACSDDGGGFVSSDAPPDKDFPDHSEEIRATNTQLVGAAYNFLSDGQIITATGSAPDQCGFVPFSYRLQKADGKLHLQQRVLMKIEQTQESIAASEQLFLAIEKCLPKVRLVWNRYNISYDLQLDREELISNYDSTVELSASEGRSHSLLFMLGDVLAGTKDFCPVLTHEAGHWLGLPDEYSEPGTCRSHAFESQDEGPWSYMETSYGYAYTDFYPRHILQVLAQAIRSKAELLPTPGTAWPLTVGGNTLLNREFVDPVSGARCQIEGTNPLPVDFNLSDGLFGLEIGTSSYVTLDWVLGGFTLARDFSLDLYPGGSTSVVGKVICNSSTPMTPQTLPSLFPAGDYGINLKPFTLEQFKTHAPLLVKAYAVP